jgi:hypothetical protein
VGDIEEFEQKHFKVANLSNIYLPIKKFPSPNLGAISFYNKSTEKSKHALSHAGAHPFEM